MQFNCDFLVIMLSDRNGFIHIGCFNDTWETTIALSINEVILNDQGKNWPLSDDKAIPTSQYIYVEHDILF